MCSGSEAGSYLRLIDFCITLGLRVFKAHRLLYNSRLESNKEGLGEADLGGNGLEFRELDLPVGVFV